MKKPLQSTNDKGVLSFHTDVLDYIRKNKALLLLIVSAFILHMIVMMPSGTETCIAGKCGLHFWGIHSHDSMWHLEIASTSFQTLPFQIPTLAGEPIVGYNLLMDFVIYLISLVGIPPIFTLFKLIPLIWFVLLTWATIHFGRKVNSNSYFVGMLLLFVYFAGNGGYILQLVKEGSIFLGSQSFSLQSLDALLNTQFALTLPILLAQLAILVDRAPSWKKTVVMIVLMALAIGLKFYGGVASAILVGWYLLDMAVQKQWKAASISATLVALAGVLVVILVYNPFQSSSTEPVFIFAPFSIVHSVIEEQNMIYLPEMVNARYYLFEQGWSARLVGIQLLSTFLYVLLNFGTRVVGLLYMMYKLLFRKISFIEAIIFSTSIVMFILSLLLIQSADWWNTVQFGYYAIFLSSILTAIAFFEIFTKSQSIVVKGFIIILVILSLPSNLRVVKEFTSKQTFVIPREEISALEVLKKAPDGVVFTSFPSEDESRVDFKNTGYVAALSRKPLYLAHLGPLKIINAPYNERLQKVESFDCELFDKVDYVYYVDVYSDELLQKCAEKLSNTFETLYESETIEVYQRK